MTMSDVVWRDVGGGRYRRILWPETCPHEEVCISERDCDALVSEYGTDWQHDDAADRRAEQ